VRRSSQASGGVVRSKEDKTRYKSMTMSTPAYWVRMPVSL